MLFDLPDESVLYDALLSRDPSFEGRVYVGVSTTRVFCRLTCPARKPKRENSRFFESISACLEAGFRPCKRCKPLASAAEADPTVTSLLNALLAKPEFRWRETDLSALGHDPSTVRRAFKRHYGITFLQMARLLRIKQGAETLRRGERVIDAQLDAGFASASGFREAFARILGASPSSFTGDESLKADWIDTPLGAMIAVADMHALHLLEFFDRRALPTELARLGKAASDSIGIGRYAVTDQIEEELSRYFSAVTAVFRTPHALFGSAFTRSVWSELRRIPPGQTRSYSEIAASVGRPSATRAVARANGANPLAIVIPCHRVIGADGALTGYGGGLWRKQWLLEHERKLARSADNIRETGDGGSGVQ